MIVGSGPEERSLRELAERGGIHDQVTFAGAKRGKELYEILNRHKILVVPSRYDEPFGVVALEGIACGCAVVGSSGGGLPEAIGPCGITFPNGNADALASALEQLLAAPDERQRLAANRSQHLAQFHPATIAESYLNLFRSLLP
jgi:glycosyltransferase involved in cell wall biosynthesis